MGGWGSGGGRDATKITEMRRIDLVDLKRLGMLREGFSGNLTWSRNCEEVARIRVSHEAGGLRLDYRFLN